MTIQVIDMHDPIDIHGLARPTDRDNITIRGTTLPLDSLLRVTLDDQVQNDAFHDRFRNAEPFEHIVFDNLFDETLLNLIVDEFPSASEAMRAVTTKNESTYRSKADHKLGTASRLYFDLVNAHPFVEFLSAVSGIRNLIVDQAMLGGGLHESRNGGKFGVHCDFNYHRDNFLNNSLVFITYLNRDWHEDYGGALELWDGSKRQRISQVEPLFGRSILFRHSARSFHGHPAPLALPPGLTRKSIAAYYYVNDVDIHKEAQWRSSVFLNDIKGDAGLATERQKLMATAGRRKKVKHTIRLFIPPIIWLSTRKLRWKLREMRMERRGS